VEEVTMKTAAEGVAPRDSAHGSPPAAELLPPRDVAGPDAAAYEVAVLRGRSGLERIAADVEHLSQSLGAEPLANFIDWHTCCLEQLADDPEAIFFCLVSRDARALAVIPLQETSRRLLGIPVVALELSNEPRMPFGDSILTDGSDPRAYLPAVWDHLARATGRRWDYVRLLNVLADSPCARAVERDPGFLKLPARVGGCCSCAVVSEEQQVSRFSGNFIRRLRKNRKRLAAAGDVVFRSVSTLPELENAYQDLLRVEASGWKGAEGTRTALQFDARMGSFYRRLLAQFAAGSRCQIHLLYVDGRPVAAQYTLVAGGTAYILKIGYDQDYAHLSPGVMLLDHLFRNVAPQSSINRIDFTTDMPWMKDWRPSRRELVEVFLFRPTLRGRLAGAYWRLARTVRYHRRAWVGPLYRRLFGSWSQRYRNKRPRQQRETE
jgi:hypothetical protein